MYCGLLSTVVYNECDTLLCDFMVLDRTSFYLAINEVFLKLSLAQLNTTLIFKTHFKTAVFCTGTTMHN